MARSSLAWIGKGISPISSRKTVPRPAATNKPGVVAVGAGERPPDVAEELVLQQVVRDRRAVDRQERGLGVGPLRMQGPRDQLLAGARLARDQDVAPRRPDLADQRLDRPHRPRPGRPSRSRSPGAWSCRRKRLVLEQEPAIAHQAVELGEQLVEDHRLHQVVMAPRRNAATAFSTVA